MTKMRVLVLNYEFPPIGGGGGDVSKNIAKHLVRFGVEVQVLTAHWGHLPYLEIVDGFTVHRIPSLRRRMDRCTVPEMFAFVLFSLLPSLKLVREWRPDVVHVHFAVPVGPLGYIIKKRYGVPYIITLHGGDVPGFDPKRTEHWYRILLPFTRPIWREASRVVAVSHGLRELALKSYPDIDILVISNGVDSEYYKPINTWRDNNENKSILIVFVGRIVEQKGLECLIQSLPLLRKKAIHPFELLIIGDGPLRKSAEKLAVELGMSDLVCFTGWLSRSQVRDWLQMADIFVLPSRVEGLSIALLQAMACGLPVVTSDVMGNRDVVIENQNGFLVPIADVHAWADALSTLINNSELRRRMGKRSRELSLSYDWSIISHKYLQIIRQIVGIGQ